MPLTGFRTGPLAAVEGGRLGGLPEEGLPEEVLHSRELPSREGHVGRIPPLDDAIQNHAARTSSERDLVAIFRVPSSLDDRVCVRLENGEELLRDGHGLFFEDPTASAWSMT